MTWAEHAVRSGRMGESEVLLGEPLKRLSTVLKSCFSLSCRTHSEAILSANHKSLTLPETTMEVEHRPLEDRFVNEGTWSAFMTVGGRATPGKYVLHPSHPAANLGLVTLICLDRLREHLRLMVLGYGSAILFLTLHSTPRIPVYRLAEPCGRRWRTREVGRTMLLHRSGSAWATPGPGASVSLPEPASPAK